MSDFLTIPTVDDHEDSLREKPHVGLIEKSKYPKISAHPWNVEMSPGGDGGGDGEQEEGAVPVKAIIAARPRPVVPVCMPRSIIFRSFCRHGP